MIPLPCKNLLFVYPDFEPTYWGMQHALPLVGRKALMPPLGLLTIAAMTPSAYEIRLVDMNCEPLSAEQIAWADVVVFSAMMMQQGSLFQAAQRCRASGKPVVFGGPYPTSFAAECRPYCDVLVLNEGEITWPRFLNDLAAGAVQPLYESSEKPDIRQTPVPRFDLVAMGNYSMVPLQYSRGCPFQCEFCDINVLYGRTPRTKTPEQMVAELDAVFATGYRGCVFVVDDNFIGNKRELLKLLPAMTRWNREHGNPFQYGTEASLNLAEDGKLLEQLIAARFLWVFVGIETPSAEALKRTNKLQNLGLPLGERVRVLQRAGLLVFGGFILGFDNETEDIFDRQIEFITNAAIPNAMVGQLGALPGTQLYSRLAGEGRLLRSLTEDGGLGPFYSNFRTTLPLATIVRGQQRILETIYEPRAYFDRLLEAYRRMRKTKPGDWVLTRIAGRLGRRHPSPLRQFSSRARAAALLRFVRRMEPGFRREALRFAGKMLFTNPERMEEALDYLVVGYHYYRFTRDSAVPEYRRVLADLDRAAECADSGDRPQRSRATVAGG